jgi:catalase
MTSPEEALELVYESYGRHDGHRALHAKGVFCRGTFIATPRAAELTRAAHMSGDAVDVTVRFSNGGGDPTVADYVPDVRGLATSFHLPDGSRTDIVSQTLPYYPFPDQEGFLQALKDRRPSPGALVRLPILAARHPKVLRTMPATLKAMLSLPASFASRSYYPFHAYKWVAADGSEHWIRYAWRPTIEEAKVSRGTAKKAGRDYLFDELRRRLAREPARMELEVQVAADGDDPHDPSSIWPDDRERFVAGTLDVTAVDPDADESIVFDPMRLTDGIEPSDDKVLHYRPAAYAISHERRTSA